MEGGAVHKPVLVKEVLALLAPADPFRLVEVKEELANLAPVDPFAAEEFKEEPGQIAPGGLSATAGAKEEAAILAPVSPLTIVDCTVGRGGHAEALMNRIGQRARLIGLDVDEENLRFCKERLKPFAGRIRLFCANFAQLKEVLLEVRMSAVDIVLADLGMASNQLEDPRRGLSFMADGPLDMRLDERIEQTAADLVNRLGEAELADLIYAYGEERYSRRIARAIVESRKIRPVERTLDLAKLVVAAYPVAVRKSRRGVHPATRTFQALRIAVNDEMGNLQRFLEALPDVLAVGGKAGVISFHSLEDRPVKQAFARWAATGCARPLNKRVITATEKEAAENPASRSAKLRAIERTA